MAYITYDNVRIGISTLDAPNPSFAFSNPVYATTFNASNSTALKRVKRIGQELDYYIQTGPKTSSISMSVIPVTGVSLNQLVNYITYTGDSTLGCYIHAPNYMFQRCFLKNLSFSLEPWKVLSANLQFDSYGLANGTDLNAYSSQTLGENQMPISPLRGMSIGITAPAFTQPISEYENLNFSIEVDHMPNFEIGQEYPTKVSVGKITKSLQINGISNVDWLSDYQPNTSVVTTMTMADGNSFSVSGILSEQTVSVDANGVAKGGLRVIEEMV